jgi:hypothetical protein
MDQTAPKIQKNCGNTHIAVNTQLYWAIIAYCLVAIAGKELKPTDQLTKYCRFWVSRHKTKHQ